MVVKKKMRASNAEASFVSYSYDNYILPRFCPTGHKTPTISAVVKIYGWPWYTNVIAIISVGYMYADMMQLDSFIKPGACLVS